MMVYQDCGEENISAIGVVVYISVDRAAVAVGYVRSADRSM